MNQIVLIALRRPYTFVVMSILIILMGTKTILKMPTDVFPNAPNAWGSYGGRPPAMPIRGTDIAARKPRRDRRRRLSASLSRIR